MPRTDAYEITFSLLAITGLALALWQFARGLVSNRDLARSGLDGVARLVSLERIVTGALGVAVFVVLSLYAVVAFDAPPIHYDLFQWRRRAIVLAILSVLVTSNAIAIYFRRRILAAAETNREGG